MSEIHSHLHNALSNENVKLYFLDASYTTVRHCVAISTPIWFELERPNPVR